MLHRHHQTVRKHNHVLAGHRSWRCCALSWVCSDATKLIRALSGHTPLWSVLDLRIVPNMLIVRLVTFFSVYQDPLNVSQPWGASLVFKFHVSYLDRFFLAILLDVLISSCRSFCRVRKPQRNCCCSLSGMFFPPSCCGIALPSRTKCLDCSNWEQAIWPQTELYMARLQICTIMCSNHIQGTYIIPKTQINVFGFSSRQLSTLAESLFHASNPSMFLVGCMSSRQLDAVTLISNKTTGSLIRRRLQLITPALGMLSIMRLHSLQTHSGWIVSGVWRQHFDVRRPSATFDHTEASLHLSLKFTSYSSLATSIVRSRLSCCFRSGIMLDGLEFATEEP